jgi:hypothetical protein
MSDSKYWLFEEWDENTPIGWWNEGRKRLNLVIRMTNVWQLDQNFDEEEGEKILAHINLGKRSWATRDGGSEWLETLITIEDFINKSINRETSNES